MTAGLETANWGVHFTLQKFRSGEQNPYEVIEGEDNLLLNAGVGAIWDRLTGTGSVTNFGNANARIGVGNGDAAASAGQTGLQGGSTEFAGMTAGHPDRDGTTLTFEAEFDDEDAVFDWEEWVVDNGTTTLNRRVVSLGEKPDNETWRLTVELTLS